MNKKSKPNVMHGLPEKVIFCKRCIMSNQRPSSSPELRKNSSDIETVHFNSDGVCHACLYSDLKEEIEDKKVAAILAYARQSENGLNPGQDLKSGTQSRATSDFNTARTRNARKGIPTSKRTASRLRNRLDRLPALSEGAVVS